MLYIYQYPDWTNFRYQQNATVNALCHVRMEQGRLLGVLSLLSGNAENDPAVTVDLRVAFALENQDLTESAERSIVAARKKFASEVTAENLCTLHAACVRGGGHFRNITCDVGVEPERIQRELSRFLKFFNESEIDGVLKASISYFWFVTIRPFDKCNEALAWFLADIQLSRCEGSAHRFYAVQNEMLKDVENYRGVLLETQKGNGEITLWLLWYLSKMKLAIENAANNFSKQISDAKRSIQLSNVALSERQLLLIKILQGENANGDLKIAHEISTTEWARLGYISHDSALRDLQDMVKKNVLVQANGGRGTRYKLVSVEKKN